MNKAKYEGLPADLKAVIDKNSGMKFAELAGNMWDDAGALVLEMVKSARQHHHRASPRTRRPSG